MAEEQTEIFNTLVEYFLPAGTLVLVLKDKEGLVLFLEECNELPEEFKDWDQAVHATEWMLFENNIGPHLSLDETALSRDELYTVITNKAARSKKEH